MNDEQYAALVVMLSAVSQVPGALRLLDRQQLDNLAFLLEQTREAVQTDLERRAGLLKIFNEEPNQ